MSGRERYVGHGLSGIDAKGRVTIPARLRGVIQANCTARFLLLSKHRSAPCLIGYDRDYSQYLPARLEAEAGERDPGAPRIGRDEIDRIAFGVVEDVPYDNSGRFILPPFMRKIGKLDDMAFFLGVDETFEIWNPRLLLEAEQMPAVVKELVEFLIAERGA